MKAVVILGATATGKSGLAMRLAERLNGEIINADALQIYRHFDIGTAKPPSTDLERVRHHLVDVLEPTETYSAGEFARRARVAIQEIESRGRLALVVGGSGLYLRALAEGLAELPKVEEQVRQELRGELARLGIGHLREELERLDPVTASRLAPADTQRTLRALEVMRASGRPLSAWLQASSRPRNALHAVKIGLTLPRALLYDKISSRARAMLAEGWMDEVRSLVARYPLEAPAFQAIGYRELVGVLAARASDTKADGEQLSAVEVTAEDIGVAVDQILVATRRYAKRQETWFRKEKGIRWLNPLEIDQALDGLVESLKSI